MKLKFRAVMVSGFTHGGGGYQIGDLRDSYDEAAEDLRAERFQSGYGDTLTCVEAIPTEGS